MARMLRITPCLTLTLLATVTLVPRGAESAAGQSERSCADRCAAVHLPIALVDSANGCGTVAGTQPGSSATLALSPPTVAVTSAGPGSSRAVVTTVTSLAVVVGLFLLVVWVQRRAGASRRGMLPGEVFETLGRVPLNGRQEMHLVRLGNKLLLLAVTAQGAETLTEITDPREIERLSGICRHNRADSISASFREILSQLGGPGGARGVHCLSGR